MSSAEGDLTYLVYRVTRLCIRSGKPHIDVIFAQPFQKTHKSCVNLQDIRAHHAVFSLSLKGGSFDRIG